jgi:dihydroflavonol-4-reductase
MSLKQILELVARHRGLPPPRIRLPHWIVYPIAAGSEAVSRLTKREPRVSMDSVRMSSKHMYFSSRKAETELDYRWRDPAKAVTDAIEWFERHGYLS